jgi:hypothetical protein
MVPDLPGPPDRVRQVEFELGRIEGPLARQFLPAIIGRRAPGRGDRVAQHLLRLVPFRVGAEALFGPQRELDRVRLEAEIAIDAVEQVAERHDLADQLVLAAEDMRVVLRELAHPHDAVQRAVRLVPVAHAIFRHADRQVAVAGDALLEDQHVRRAVHRLERHQVAGAGQHRRVLVVEGISSGTTNMFSRYLPQWPDRSHCRASISCGVLTSS